MHLKLRDQQFKTVTQIYRETLPYIKVMVTTNQKSIIDTQKSYQITREENKRRKEQKKNYKNKPKTIKKIAIRTYLSIIILNINGLTAPIKRHRIAEWIQKQDPYICCLQQTQFRSKDTHKLKVKEQKKVFYSNGNKKETRVAILRQNRL